MFEINFLLGILLICAVKQPSEILGNWNHVLLNNIPTIYIAFNMQIIFLFVLLFYVAF